jgi:alanine or glycine:cation symporter, AGCS family
MLQSLESFINVQNGFWWIKVLIPLLLGLGLYFTIRTKFVQFRLIGEMFRLLTDKAMVTTDGKKGISSFASFCIGAATRIGTGNLAGVAVAITLGGPGAVFWMWMVALLGGATSFVESTLAQVYKVKDKDGFKGGPAYYMQKALKARWMGILFAIFTALSFGLIFNAVQSNTIASAFNGAFGVDATLIGVILVVLTAAVIFGGVKRIAKVSQIVVPIMAVFYLLLGLYVMVINITEIPAVLSMIFKSAFGFEEVFSGALGAAIMNGVKRGLFSNEAGMGSAPNAAATAVVSHPAKQGLVQTLGVFVDTLFVCSATAFIILLGDVPFGQEIQGIQLLQQNLSVQVGSWASIFVAISIFLFAFSSIIGSYYYGETNISFINDNKTWLMTYRVLALGMVLWGSMASLSIVWSLADLSMAFMAITNLVAIALLGKVAFKVLDDYMAQRKAGKDPVFYADSIEGLENVECWDRKEDAKKEKAS